LVRSTGGAHEATGQSDGACNVYCAPQDKRSGLISFGELCGYEWDYPDSVDRCQGYTGVNAQLC